MESIDAAVADDDVAWGLNVRSSSSSELALPSKEDPRAESRRLQSESSINISNALGLLGIWPNWLALSRLLVAVLVGVLAAVVVAVVVEEPFIMLLLLDMRAGGVEDEVVNDASGVWGVPFSCCCCWSKNMSSSLALNLASSALLLSSSTLLSRIKRKSSGWDW